MTRFLHHLLRLPLSRHLRQLTPHLLPTRGKVPPLPVKDEPRENGDGNDGDNDDDDAFSFIGDVSEISGGKGSPASVLVVLERRRISILLIPINLLKCRIDTMNTLRSVDRKKKRIETSLAKTTNKD
eukprot:TRINITY_DN15526_c0_g1_i1.p1 TRINITY_DN15526_c0_g1~~TRINITY_DN15526_c0_g1_i1.p1  ORF type:complete len:127 (-),score=22.62 TRINITY_DN15526_c0_g1_i1:117-497(-)